MAYITNSDKMLQAVLINPKLMEYGNYTPNDFSTLSQALISDYCCPIKIFEAG